MIAQWTFQSYDYEILDISWTVLIHTHFKIMNLLISLAVMD